MITPKYIAVREGGTMEAKANLGDPWTELTDGAAVDIQAADQADGTTWFAYLTSTGELYVKDGLNGSWYDEAGGVSQYVITPSGYMMVREGSSVEAKAGLTTAWSTLQSSGATDIQSAGNQFAYLTSTGELYVKDGLNGSWYDEAGGVSQYVITPKYIAVREGGTMEAKANLGDPWTELTDGAAVSIEAADQSDGTTWYAYLTSSGELYVKDGLNGPWYDEAGGVSQYVITSS